MSGRWSPGEQFGRYAIEALLGRGGMGEVYVARDTQLGRRVALKMLHGAGDDARLLREARAAAAIDHPNIARVFDVDTVDGVPFLAMEHVEGKTLRAYVGDASVTLDTKVKWLAAIGRALSAAHARGIVHRDVKPENIIVRHDGVVKVLDFGIARTVPLVDREAETRTGPGTPELLVTVPGATHGTNAKGTLAYMAPEQLRRETIDASADQWAWGVVSYELLTGRRPWRSESDQLALVAEILSVDPPSMPGVAATLDQCVRKTLAKRRSDRFTDMRQVVVAIETNSLGRPTSEASRTRATKVALIVLTAVALSAAVAMRIRSSLRQRALLAEQRDAGSAVNPLGGVGPPDYGSQMSTNPSALDAYRMGVDGMNGAATDLNVEAHFVEARKADPAFAAAYFRALLVMGSAANAFEVENFLHPRRGQLGAHDLALLNAVEPWFRAPLDKEELRRRFDSLPWRLDADYSAQRCLFFLRTGWYEDAKEACLVSQRLRPDLAIGYLGEGLSRRELNDPDGASKAYERCTAVAPGATRCLTGHARISAVRGRCDDQIADFERAIGLAPDEADLRRNYAMALLARDVRAKADMSAYRRAAAAYVDRFSLIATSPDLVKVEKNYYESRALIAEGRLDEAYAALEEVAGVFRAMNLETNVAGIYADQLPLLVELGKRERAVRFAKRWLEEREAWTPSPSLNSRIIPLEALFGVGALPASRFIDERQRWEIDAKASSTAYRPLLWAIAYGPPPTSKAEAREALDARARFGLFPQIGDTFELDYWTGVVRLRAGEREAAVSSLSAATRTCNAATALLPFVQSFVSLGDALRSQGDNSAACEAYGVVLARWGQTARSTSAARASAEWERLHCATR